MRWYRQVKGRGTGGLVPSTAVSCSKWLLSPRLPSVGSTGWIWPMGSRWFFGNSLKWCDAAQGCLPAWDPKQDSHGCMLHQSCLQPPAGLWSAREQQQQDNLPSCFYICLITSAECKARSQAGSNPALMHLILKHTKTKNLTATPVAITQVLSGDPQHRHLSWRATSAAPAVPQGLTAAASMLPLSPVTVNISIHTLTNTHRLQKQQI